MLHAARTITALLASAAITLLGATVAHADGAVPTPVTVSGVVTDATTQTPIAGVTVEWVNPATGKTAGAVRTDATGTYSLDVATRKGMPFIAAGVPIHSRKYEVVTAGHVGAFAGNADTTGQVYQLLTPIAADPTVNRIQNFALGQAGGLKVVAPNAQHLGFGLTTLNGVPVGKNTAQVAGAYSFPNIVPGRYKVACSTIHGWSVLKTSTITVRPGATTTFRTSAKCIIPPARRLHLVPKHGATAHISGQLAFGSTTLSNLNLKMARQGLESRSGYLFVDASEIEDFTDSGEYWAAGTYTVTVYNDDRNIGAHSNFWSTGLSLPVGSPYWLTVPAKMSTLHLTAGQHLDLGSMQLVLHS